jgi:hypothetical protein
VEDGLVSSRRICVRIAIDLIRPEPLLTASPRNAVFGVHSGILIDVALVERIPRKIPDPATQFVIAPKYRTIEIERIRRMFLDRSEDCLDVFRKFQKPAVQEDIVLQ